MGTFCLGSASAKRPTGIDGLPTDRTSKDASVTMEYGAPAVPGKDAPGMAKALDEIAEAIIIGQH